MIQILKKTLSSLETSGKDLDCLALLGSDSDGLLFNLFALHLFLLLVIVFVSVILIIVVIVLALDYGLLFLSRLSVLLVSPHLLLEGGTLEPIAVK